MSYFKLLKNFNGSFPGETVKVSDHLDSRMILYKIGEKIEEIKPAEVKPSEISGDKNKMIAPVYKNKPGRKSKK